MLLKAIIEAKVSLSVKLTYRRSIWIRPANSCCDHVVLVDMEIDRFASDM